MFAGNSRLDKQQITIISVSNEVSEIAGFLCIFIKRKSYRICRFIVNRSGHISTFKESGGTSFLGASTQLNKSSVINCKKVKTVTFAKSRKKYISIQANIL